MKDLNERINKEIEKRANAKDPETLRAIQKKLILEENTKKVFEMLYQKFNKKYSNLEDMSLRELLKEPYIYMHMEAKKTNYVEETSDIDLDGDSYPYNRNGDCFSLSRLKELAEEAGFIIWTSGYRASGEWKDVTCEINDIPGCECLEVPEGHRGTMKTGKVEIVEKAYDIYFKALVNKKDRNITRR